MAATYRITYVLGKLDANSNPPVVAGVLFPGATITSCTVSEEEYLVTLEEAQNPVDLGPLVKVEQITE